MLNRNLFCMLRFQIHTRRREPAVRSKGALSPLGGPAGQPCHPRLSPCFTLCQNASQATQRNGHWKLPDFQSSYFPIVLPFQGLAILRRGPGRAVLAAFIFKQEAPHQRGGARCPHRPGLWDPRWLWDLRPAWADSELPFCCYASGQSDPAPSSWIRPRRACPRALCGLPLLGPRRAREGHVLQPPWPSHPPQQRAFAHTGPVPECPLPRSLRGHLPLVRLGASPAMSAPKEHKRSRRHRSSPEGPRHWRPRCPAAGAGAALGHTHNLARSLGRAQCPCSPLFGITPLPALPMQSLVWHHTFGSSFPSPPTSPLLAASQTVWGRACTPSSPPAALSSCSSALLSQRFFCVSNCWLICINVSSVYGTAGSFVSTGSSTQRAEAPQRETVLCVSPPGGAGTPKPVSPLTNTQ